LLLFRGSTLRRLNEDHSMLPTLIDMARNAGRDIEHARRDWRRHQLRSALTGEPPALIVYRHHSSGR
jgi:hypothetical protein